MFMVKPVLFCRNIALAKAEFDDKKKDIAQQLISNFFKPLPQNNWENIEVDKYWNEMEASGHKQNLD